MEPHCLDNRLGYYHKTQFHHGPAVPGPTITSITPASGNIDTTVLFTIVGTNFQTDFNKTNVTIYNDVTNDVLTTTVLNIMPTKIIGSAAIGSAPAGAYNVNVTTVDGGMAPKSGTFMVGYLAIPTITSLTPVSGLRNTTVKFTVTGTTLSRAQSRLLSYSRTRPPVRP